MTADRLSARMAVTHSDALVSRPGVGLAPMTGRSAETATTALVPM